MKKRLACILWIAAQLAAARLLADDGVAEVGIAQAAEDGLPRPTIGIAAPASPTLAFYLSLNYRCPAAMGQRQLFVSIADTAHFDEIPAGQPPPVTLRVDVPIDQLQWLAQPDLACATASDHRPPDHVDNSGIRFFRLHAGAAGFVTLTCRGDDGREAAANSTTPLDVWLSCPRPAEESAVR